MFIASKAREDKICEHCGNIIPKGNYYETYDGYNYHLQCLWDRIINDKLSNTYEASNEFFMSLKDNIGNWPNVNMDTEADYEQDLMLVEHNNRINMGNI